MRSSKRRSGNESLPAPSAPATPAADSGGHDENSPRRSPRKRLRTEPAASPKAQTKLIDFYAAVAIPPDHTLKELNPSPPADDGIVLEKRTSVARVAVAADEQTVEEVVCAVEVDVALAAATEAAPEPAATETAPEPAATETAPEPAATAAETEPESAAATATETAPQPAAAEPSAATATATETVPESAAAQPGTSQPAPAAETEPESAAATATETAPQPAAAEPSAATATATETVPESAAAQPGTSQPAPAAETEPESAAATATETAPQPAAAEPSAATATATETVPESAAAQPGTSQPAPAAVPARLASDCDAHDVGQLCWALEGKLGTKKCCWWPVIIVDKCLTQSLPEPDLRRLKNSKDASIDRDDVRYVMYLPQGRTACYRVHNLKPFESADTDPYKSKRTEDGAALAQKLRPVADLNERPKHLIKVKNKLDFVEDYEAYAAEQEMLAQEQRQREQERKRLAKERRRSLMLEQKQQAQQQHNTTVAPLGLEDELSDTSCSPAASTAQQPAEEAQEDVEYTDDDKKRGGLMYLYSSAPTCFLRQWLVDTTADRVLRCRGACARTFSLAAVQEDRPDWPIDMADNTVLCDECAKGSDGGNACAKCGSASRPDAPTYRCAYKGKDGCRFYFHLACVQQWTFARSSEEPPVVVDGTSFVCKAHACRTCAINGKTVNREFVSHHPIRCVQCPTMYHFNVECVPAGAEIINQRHLNCPRHFVVSKKGKKGASTKNAAHVDICQSCCKGDGGELVCCDQCPMAYHYECVSLSDAEIQHVKEPDFSWLCQNCAVGVELKYNDLVWAKWWPSQIVHPEKLPSNIEGLQHSPGELGVKFLGTSDYGWIPCSRVYAISDDDKLSVGAKKGGSKLEQQYFEGLRQAEELRQQLRAARSDTVARRQLGNCNALPHFKHIKLGMLQDNTYEHVGGEQRLLPAAAAADSDDDEPLLDGPVCRCPIEEHLTLLTRQCDSGKCETVASNTECPTNCEAGGACANNRFREHSYAQVVPFQTKHRGWGLRALEFIEKDQFVIEYCGEVISTAQMHARIKQQNSNSNTNFYILQLDKELYIDAGPAGNVARFMNHSCEPNCRPYVWTVGRQKRVGLFAIHDIEPGQELTFDYRLDSRGIDAETKMACRCAARRCVGVIDAGSKADLPAAAAAADTAVAAAKPKPKQRRSAHVLTPKQSDKKEKQPSRHQRSL